MKDLHHKVIVITGSANGLGKAMAKAFYKQGSDLALIDIDNEKLEILKNELEIKGQLITIYQADVSSEEQIRSARKLIIEQHKRVDILVNNAGISLSQLFEKVDICDFKRLFETNFWGTIFCSKYFMADLNRQRESHLINIISGFALLGFPGKVCYCSSKSAIMGFSNALKTELNGTGTKISLVIPPPLDTGLIWSGKHINEVKQQREAVFLKNNAMSIDKAADKIIKGIKKGKYRIVIGRVMFWTDLAVRLLPTTLHHLIGKNKKRFDFI